MTTLAEFVRNTEFFVIAHRGDSGRAPENTLAAITLALQSGSPMIEIDVQGTADHSLVVFHDSVLGRTTNGHGQIRMFSAGEVRALDAGGWFSPDFAGERIPYLTEALDLIQGNAYLNIEVKSHAGDANTILHTQLLLQEIRKRDLFPFTMFSSFDHELLLDLRKAVPNIITCALNVPADTRLPSDVVASCMANSYGCSVHELTTIKAENCSMHRLPWGAYTVNTPEQLQYVRTYGLHAVVSNHPSTLLQYLP